ncbi:MAG: hypothetical protein AB7V58_06770, partial [Solirubrobacterales bacterium]
MADTGPISLDDAREVVLAAAAPLPAVEVALAAAPGGSRWRRSSGVRRRPPNPRETNPPSLILARGYRRPARGRRR